MSPATSSSGLMPIWNYMIIGLHQLSWKPNYYLLYSLYKHNVFGFQITDLNK